MPDANRMLVGPVLLMGHVAWSTGRTMTRVVDVRDWV